MNSWLNKMAAKCRLLCHQSDAERTKNLATLFLPQESVVCYLKSIGAALAKQLSYSRKTSVPFAGLFFFLLETFSAIHDVSFHEYLRASIIQFELFVKEAAEYLYVWQDPLGFTFTDVHKSNDPDRIFLSFSLFFFLLSLLNLLISAF